MAPTHDNVQREGCLEFECDVLQLQVDDGLSFFHSHDGQAVIGLAALSALDLVVTCGQHTVIAAIR